MSIILNNTIIPDEYWTGDNLLENECAWLVPEAIIKLDNIIKKDMDILEFGGGGSTLFFARRAKSVLTYEPNNDWRNKIKSELKNKLISNVFFVENISYIDFTKHYGLILIDCANRQFVINLMMTFNLDKSIIVIDNYGRYRINFEFKTAEYYNDLHWDGKGTMIIYN